MLRTLHNKNSPTGKESLVCLFSAVHTVILKRIVTEAFIFGVGVFTSLRLREMMRRSLRAAGLGRHESGPSSSDHQDPVSPPIAPPSWVPDPPPMDPGK